MVILEHSIYWNFFSRLVTKNKYTIQNDVLLTIEGLDAVELITLELRFRNPLGQ